MSDPILEEEDDLISQDDIDKMLNMSSDDDDVGELSQDDIDSLLSDPEPDVDDPETGELSQDDIDRMMAGDTPDNGDSAEDDGELSQDDINSLLNDPAPDTDDSDDGEEEVAELSQDDIDRMMSGDAPDEDSLEDDGGELSQDDIDSLLNGPAPDADDSDDGEEEAAELSQDDIDRMMAGDAQSDDTSEDDDEFISLEDIQVAMSADTQDNDAFGSQPDPAPVVETEPEPEALEAQSNQEDLEEQNETNENADDASMAEVSDLEEDPFDEPIDESQAADMADCMITQEAMDALIEAGFPAPDIPQTDAGDSEGNLLEETEPAAATDAGATNDAAAEDENDVTQEDIDALLQESDETDGSLDEDILISQDDINTLLMAADQEDDDVLADIAGEDNAPDLEDHLDDLESDSADQVVLEGIDGTGAEDSAPAKAKKGGKIKALLKSKVFLAAASILLFMGISVPLSYFLFFSGGSGPKPQPGRQTASLTEIDLIRDGQAKGSADVPALPPSRRPGTIVLTDFIILASDQSQTMTYVYADVSIDYSDQRAYDEINSNIAFYRDLIYGAIHSRLISEKNNEVTEADLLWGVEASLKKVLPPQYIDKISFKSFKAT
ncbi:hypothetical protein [uncultured Desulfobacter sp.]|uniref:hypothetical protein n=1 Tax=uncultured Desulfobacter sp. TaxID=240139 RepID=UPI002AAABFBB|nr:hypothetical protein [uncultured Desulfobacter sp.]